MQRVARVRQLCAAEPVFNRHTSRRHAERLRLCLGVRCGRIVIELDRKQLQNQERQ